MKGLFAQNITATGTIEGVKLEGATGNFNGSVTASSLTATNSGKISIFYFDSGGIYADLSGDNVRDYAFQKEHFCARIYNSSNQERAYFYMDTEEREPATKGRVIIFGNEVVDLRVNSNGGIYFTNEETVRY